MPGGRIRPIQRRQDSCGDDNANSILKFHSKTGRREKQPSLNARQ
jgi:hypothetical protein